jgi:uncharacterized protein
MPKALIPRQGGAKTRRRPLPAGAFSSWLARTQRALRAGTGMRVRCGSCRACCTSSYFIHLDPKETRTLARIPKKFLAPAPGWPRGHVVLGYLENGHCPLFARNACSLYAHRPLACRHYDCRLFAATGLTPGGRDKAQISARARRWRFAYPTPRDRRLQAAVRAAARYLQNQARRLPNGAKPENPSQQAVLAINLHNVFLKRLKAHGKTLVVLPDGQVVWARLQVKGKQAGGRKSGAGRRP